MQKTDLSQLDQQHVLNDHLVSDVGNFRACKKTPFKLRRKNIRRCKVCRKRFSNEDVFKAHLNLHQRSQQISYNFKYVCRECNTSHKGLSALYEHQKIHQQDFVSNDFVTTTSENLEISHNPSEHSSTAQVLVTTPGGDFELTTVSQPNEETVHHGESLQSMSNFVSQQSEALTSDVLNPNNTLLSHRAASKPNTDDGVHIEIPNHVKAIYLRSENNASLATISKQLDLLNDKVDALIKHLNIPADGDGNAVPLATNTIEVQNDKELHHEGVLVDGFPPSYSIIQAAKEQQQQEFYALTLTNRQAQQVFKGEHILTATPEDVKNLQKGKGIDLWVPSQQYISQLVDEERVPAHIIEKVFVESRSRANFAKNLTFAIFSAEERQGKNCTGRVFGRAQLKEQLDASKLQMVKEATFRKYPCQTNLIDITWRKECITAIDSGLRNENRSARSTNQNAQQQLNSQSCAVVNE